MESRALRGFFYRCGAMPREFWQGSFSSGTWRSLLVAATDGGEDVQPAAGAAGADCGVPPAAEAGPSGAAGVHAVRATQANIASHGAGEVSIAGS